MSKIIRLKKGIFDQTHPAIPEEQTINYTSQRLTETLFHESHPLFQKLLESFDEKDIRSRRIRFDICGKALYTKHPVSGKNMIVLNLTALSLQMVMRDTRVKQSEESDAQTALMQKTIESYFSEQGFSLPCDSSDEIERFLEYLANDIPEVWNYFRVITKAE